MTYSYSPQSDPAVTAANLMQRMGFFTLLLLLPFISTISRRAGVVLFPTAIGFFLIALVFAQSKPSVMPLKRALFSVPAVSGLLILLWCGLSLLWTPLFDQAFQRLIDFLIALSLLTLGYYSLPDRVRASNINLLPIGVFLSAISLIYTAIISKTGLMSIDSDHYLRALLAFVLFLWPALAWLVFRNYRIMILILMVVAIAAVFLGDRLIPKLALGTGFILFFLSLIHRQSTAYLLCAIISGMFLLAPFIGFMVPLFKNITPDFLTGSLSAYEEWWQIIVSDPLRLITGYGLEAATRRHLSHTLPSSLIFAAWFELGILGALAASALTTGIILITLKSQSLMTPGVFAAIGAAFMCGLLGVRSTQLWWFTTSAALILTFVAAQRSQFRTNRPLAFFR